MITETKVEEAIEFLSESTEEFSRLKGQVTVFEYKLRIIESSEYLGVDSGTQEYKKSRARASFAYREAVTEYEEVLEQFTLVQSKRKTAETIISVWQSQQKAKSQGVI